MILQGCCSIHSAFVLCFLQLPWSFSQRSIDSQKHSGQCLNEFITKAIQFSNLETCQAFLFLSNQWQWESNYSCHSSVCPLTSPPHRFWPVYPPSPLALSRILPAPQYCLWSTSRIPKWFYFCTLTSGYTTVWNNWSNYFNSYMDSLSTCYHLCLYLSLISLKLFWILILGSNETKTGLSRISRREGHILSGLR